MTTKSSIAQARYELAQHRAAKAAKAAKSLEVKAFNAQEKERLKLAIVEYKARKLLARDMDLIRRQENRISALAKLSKGGGHSRPRDVLIRQIREAIARNEMIVSEAMARTMFNKFER